jgi:hypothetical protein
MFSTLVVVLFVVGCEGDQSATSTMRPTERLNGSWRVIGSPPEWEPVVFDFDKGTLVHPGLSAPDGGHTFDLTLIEDTAEAVTFEARGYTWTCSFNEDGTITVRVPGLATAEFERVE